MSNRLKELLEMASVYRMPKSRVIRYIYIPEIISMLKGNRK
ncbi:hypothetical protein [Butyrivibrio sp.]|nr:hypothetical protein [Butyrivibrio sp.]